MEAAFSNSKGQLKGQAKAAGESTAEFANKVTAKGNKASALTKKRANLALLGIKYGGKHKKGGK